MNAYDKASSLFWLAFSLSVFVESLRLGIGTLHDPGMGFVTFGASGLLAILSLIVFFQATLGGRASETEAPFANTLWRRVLLVLAALFIYAKVMPVAGYLLSTFLLMSFLFWIVRGRTWWTVFVSALLATLATYYVFSVWLNGQYPEGFLGF